MLCMTECGVGAEPRLCHRGTEPAPPVETRATIASLQAELNVHSVTRSVTYATAKLRNEVDFSKRITSPSRERREREGRPRQRPGRVFERLL